jgi:3-hydroxyanthranilate 3,4-dioxygenase
MIHSPLNFKAWIDENRHLLKPPVGNKCVWEDGDYIVMVVGGPNSRKDYHFNKTPEFFYQVEGDINLRIIDKGVQRDIPIKEGEIFLLPAGVPHSPQRGANTVGLVIETKRPKQMKDGMLWFCESCGHKLYEEKFYCANIENDLPRIMKEFYSNEALRTCKKCSNIMQPPLPPKA